MTPFTITAHHSGNGLSGNRGLKTDSGNLREVAQFGPSLLGANPKTGCGYLRLPVP